MNEKAEKIAYHPGFAGGMELLMWEYREVLTIETEHELNREPTRIDLLIIKKDPGTQIDYEIAEIFREHNLIEYKSPGDELSVDEVAQILSYVFAYKYQGSHVNAVPFSELSASLFRHSSPQKLFRQLQQEGYTITCKYPGIYYVEGLVDIPLQIVITKELQGEKYRPLRILAPDADPDEIRKFLEGCLIISDPAHRKAASAIVTVCSEANREAFVKIMEDKKMGGVLAELMKDDLEKERREGKEEGRAEGKAEGKILGAVEAWREDGKDDQTIISRIVAKYNLSEDEAKEYVLTPA